MINYYSLAVGSASGFLNSHVVHVNLAVINSVVTNCSTLQTYTPVPRASALAVSYMCTRDRKIIWSDL